jgi:hypothetical protein
MNFHSLCDLDTHMNLFHIKHFIDSSCQAASCWYMHVHVCVYVPMSTCDVCTSMYGCIYLYVHMRMCVYVCVYVCMYMNVDICMYVCACVPAVSQLPYYMHTQAAKQLHAFMWVYPGSGMVGLYLPIYLSTYPPSLLKHLLWVIYLLRLMM